MKVAAAQTCLMLPPKRTTERNKARKDYEFFHHVPPTDKLIRDLKPNNEHQLTTRHILPNIALHFKF